MNEQHLDIMSNGTIFPTYTRNLRIKNPLCLNWKQGTRNMLLSILKKFYNFLNLNVIEKSP